MTRLRHICLMTLVCAALMAHADGIVRWLEMEYDFGTIHEEDGKVSCTMRLVNDGDEAAMASALLWMTTHQEERLRMGLQAREAVKTYLIDEVMKRWQSLFDL